MAVQARRVQIIIACNMIARLTRSEPSVNFSAFDMLTCAAFSCHVTHPTSYHSLKKAAPGGRTPEISRYAKVIPPPYRDGHRILF
jgi:hypothetical protein